MMPLPNSIRIAADVGGTFTDVIALDDRGGIWTHKLLSSPPDFEQAVLDAIKLFLEENKERGESVAEVAHGTTVAANAVLEHRGALTALITTKGFRDVLELRRVRALPHVLHIEIRVEIPVREIYLQVPLFNHLLCAGNFGVLRFCRGQEFLKGIWQILFWQFSRCYVGRSLRAADKLLELGLHFCRFEMVHGNFAEQFDLLKLGL